MYSLVVLRSKDPSACSDADEIASVTASTNLLYEYLWKVLVLFALWSLCLITLIFGDLARLEHLVGLWSFSFEELLHGLAPQY